MIESCCLSGLIFLKFMSVESCYLSRLEGWVATQVVGGDGGWWVVSGGSGGAQ
ncbi:hypothetical protein HanRHA438_Chr16g0788591 [Helianthus annuus]|nr:hypothetical protein HanRHA438_Chr16g0788591 [Helianthus annuus]